jgi:hypothetical protein
VCPAARADLLLVLHEDGAGDAYQGVVVVNNQKKRNRIVIETWGEGCE